MIDPELVRIGKELFFSHGDLAQQPSQGPHVLGQNVSCSDCHSGTAFTDNRDHPVGPTEDRDTVVRQAPHLLRIDETAPFGWDGRFPCLQAVIKAAILAPREMNAARAPTQRQLDALAEFVRTLDVPDAVPGTDFDPALAQMGQQIFTTPRGTDLSGEFSPDAKIACTTCHSGPRISDNGFHRLIVPGLVGNLPTFDPGHVDSSGFILGFQTPPLRGLRLTAPYFHDGSFGGGSGPPVPINEQPRAALLELVNFYDARFLFNMTPLEKLALVEFLLSL